MEHTLAYMADDVRKEQARVAYLERALEMYALDVWPEIQTKLAEYPKARTMSYYE